MPKPKFYGYRAIRKEMSRIARRKEDREMANEHEKGTATQGVKPNGNGDPYAHRGPVREETADTNGLTGAGNAREIPIPQNQNVPSGTVVTDYERKALGK